jgi:hypothetical protein
MHPAKIGRDDWIRTSDPLTPRRQEGDNPGQPHTAAPDFIEFLSSPQPPETTPSRYRLSAICQPLYIVKYEADSGGLGLLCELHDRFASFERGNDLREFRFKSREQRRATRVTYSHPNNRRSFVQKSMDREVLVLRHDRGSNVGGVFSNLAVRRLRPSAIEDVLRAVSERFNASCERRRELSVDEKAQSCAPQNRVIVLPGRELKNCGDVVSFEIRIVRENLLAAGTRSQEIEHVLHADAKTPNTRPATTDVRIHGNSFDRAHTSIVDRLNHRRGRHHGF